jgi:nicotinamidase-related amidase
VTEVPAGPYEFAFSPPSTALVVIDMQRDFLEPGGFGEMLGKRSWSRRVAGIAHSSQASAPTWRTILPSRTSQM